MSKQQQGSPGHEWDDEVMQKLDSGLRHLLRLTDDEILREVEAHDIRQLEMIGEFEELVNILPSTATEQDREVVRQVKELYRDQLRPHPIYGPLIIDKAKLVPIKLPAIVQFTGNRDDLAGMGFEVRTQAHDIFTVVGTLKQFANLAAQPATQNLELPSVLIPGMEHASAQAQVSEVHSVRWNNPQGYKGKDVIVGIIDSPLDVAHHAFRIPGTTNTRVLHYWVQDPSVTDPTKTPAAIDPLFKDYDYGRLYTEKDINTALGVVGGPYGPGKNVISRTPTAGEHGTEVAAIAAGNGYEPKWATKPKHIGAAPEADIVHVTNGSFNSDKIIDALKFILLAAKKESKPAAVNISLSGNTGSHLGNDSLSLAVDNLLNSHSNRVVIGITQNWNAEDGFGRGTINVGGSEQFLLTPTKSLPVVDLNIYYDVARLAPGEQLAIPLPSILEYQLSIGNDASGWKRDHLQYSGALKGHAVQAVCGLAFSKISSYRYRFISIDVQNATKSDPLKIELRTVDNSKREYYAWVSPDASYAKLSNATHDELTLSNDGCCKSMLTVGACAKMIPPKPKAIKGETIAGYSGAGPTIDGRIKPEIVAVGGVANPSDPLFGPLITANSHPTSDQKRDYSVGVEGTSFAAPLVTGAAALLFEEAKLLGYKLDHDTIKALLTQNAHSGDLHLDPAKTGYAPKDRNRYGYGRLRLLAPIDHLRPPVNVDVWIRTADDDYGNEPFIGDYFWGAPDIAVYDHGTSNKVSELRWNKLYDVKVIVRNLGDDKAVGTTLSLMYTRPVVAPNAWFEAEDDQNQKLKIKKVEVPALGQTTVTFKKWRPERAEIGAKANEKHFCVLVEADHPKDTIAYKAGDAWEMNIKRHNNVALRNVIIKK